jgi:hypothetical protein
VVVFGDLHANGHVKDAHGRKAHRKAVSLACLLMAHSQLGIASRVAFTSNITTAATGIPIDLFRRNAAKAIAEWRLLTKRGDCDSCTFCASRNILHFCLLLFSEGRKSTQSLHVIKHGKVLLINVYRSDGVGRRKFMPLN